MSVKAKLKCLEYKYTGVESAVEQLSCSKDIKHQVTTMSIEEKFADLQCDPLADHIIQLLFSARKLKILAEVLKLGIFDQIEKLQNSVTVDTLSVHNGFNIDITERLLNTLVCMGFLEKSTSNYRYRNSSSTRKYLLQTKSPNLICLIKVELEMILPLMEKLSMRLTQGSSDHVFKSMIKGKNLDSEDTSNNNNTDQNKNPITVIENKTACTPSPHVFMTVMDAMMAPSVGAIATAFDLSGYTKLLDLGGSSGFLAYQFIKNYPQMKATVFDVPATIKIAKQHQPKNTESRVQFVEGNFFEGQLPEADVIVLSHVVHNWGKDKLNQLLQKCYQFLPAGGCILVVEKYLNEDKHGPESSVLMDISMSVICEGKERTATEYKTLLNEHGFSKIKMKRLTDSNFYDVILGQKPF